MNEPEAIFPKGEQGSAETFNGKAWHCSLVPNDSVYNTVEGNVYFAPAPAATGIRTRAARS